MPPPRDLTDWIQDRVIVRAAQLNLTAEEVSERSGVPLLHVQEYFGRKSSMGSHRLQHVLKALGLDLHPAK